MSILTDVFVRLSNLLVVSSPDLLNPGFAVKPLPDGLVGLNELVKLLREVLILNSDYSDMVVQGINFNLEVRIIVKKSRVAESGTL